MAGIYKVGFPDGTPLAEAKERALAMIRADQIVIGDDGDEVTVPGDQDPVTFGPDVVQSVPHSDVQTAETLAGAGTFLVRVVTGLAEDPAVVAAAKRAAAADVPEADAMVGRLLDLPPAKLAALSALLDRLEE